MDTLLSNLGEAVSDISFWVFRWKSIAIILLCLAYLCPRLGSRLFRAMEHLSGRIIRQRALAITLVGVLTFALAASMSLLIRFPIPWIADEFSYLLAADTFANGRLANPTHPMWRHFEAFFVLQEPAYASAYPPGKGLIMALGQASVGLPIAGEWLATALACAAICWMLLGWVPPRWAMLGGFLAAVHPMIFAWGQRYWGSSLALLGGTLVLGALPRLLKAPTVKNALLMALGMAMLANTRPYGGLVVSSTTMIILFASFCRNRSQSFRLACIRVLLPVGLIVTLTLCWIGYYNHQVTGNAKLLPAALSARQNGITPIFLWQKPRPPPEYRVADIRDHQFNYAFTFYKEQHSLNGFLAMQKERIIDLERGYFPLSVLEFPTLLVPAGLLVATLPGIWRNRKVRLAIMICLIFYASFLQVTWMQAHYAAPIAGLFFVIGLQILRHLRLWQWRIRPGGRVLPSGLFLMRSLVVLCVVAFVFQSTHLAEGYTPGVQRLPRAYTPAWAIHRARIMSELESQPGNHLIIVHYGPQHRHWEHWVFNDADIDNAKIVWARDLGEERNRELIEYFKVRRVWLLEADASSPKPRPYGEATDSTNEHE